MPKNLLEGMDLINSQQKQPVNLLEKSDDSNKQSLLSSLLSGAAQLGTGLLQGAAQTGRNVGELETSLFNRLFGTNLEAPKVDLYRPLGVQRSGLAKAGEVGGQIGGDIALTSALTPVIGGPLALGATGAMTTEGGVKERATGAGIGASLGYGGNLLSKGLEQALLHTRAKSLANAIEKHAADVNSTKNSLYKSLYDGTENVRPTVTPEFIQHLNAATKSKGVSELKRTVKMFSENPNPSTLHDIRKSVGRLSRKLGEKELKSGLEPADRELKYLLVNELTPSIDQSLEKTFNKLSPQKYSEFQNAQNYYREHVVPMNKFKSIKDLLGEERKITPALKRDIMQDSKSAEALRQQLGISPIAGKAMQLPGVKNLLRFELLSKLLG